MQSLGFLVFPTNLIWSFSWEISNGTIPKIWSKCVFLRGIRLGMKAHIDNLMGKTSHCYLLSTFALQPIKSEPYFLCHSGLLGTFSEVSHADLSFSSFCGLFAWPRSFHSIGEWAAPGIEC